MSTDTRERQRKGPGRILICGQNIANQITDFRSALDEAGYDVRSCGFARNPYYTNSQQDLEIAPWTDRIGNKVLRVLLQIVMRYPAFFRVLFGYDTYIYIWRSTFWPLKLDLFLLRLLGRQVIVMHCGSDVRYRPIQSKIDIQDFDVRYFGEGDDAALKAYLREGAGFGRSFFSQWLTDRSGAQIISLRSHATFQSRRSYFFRFPQKALLTEISSPDQIKARALPLIIHAPTDRKGKGTAYVLEAVAALEAEGLNFTFEIIEKKPNAYVLQRLAEADIVIDQPGPWFGKLGVEAFATGCVLISGNRHDYYGIADESPAVQFPTNSGELADRLRELINDPEARQAKMQAGFAYWQRTYSNTAFIRFIASVMATSEEAIRFDPMPDHKARLIRYASNPLHRLIIRLFYR